MTVDRWDGWREGGELGFVINHLWRPGEREAGG
jgi:hypothetical protein